ncbi:hypothetical protein HDV00_000570 [Rhizophlyctis rosea]|nr:hypothetical protein HDV00_000570 [Rhizophlyctis rosea]
MAMMRWKYSASKNGPGILTLEALLQNTGADGVDFWIGEAVRLTRSDMLSWIIRVVRMYSCDTQAKGERLLRAFQSCALKAVRGGWLEGVCVICDAIEWGIMMGNANILTWQWLGSDFLTNFVVESVSLAASMKQFDIVDFLFQTANNLSSKIPHPFLPDCFASCLNRTLIAYGISNSIDTAHFLTVVHNCGVLATIWIQSHPEAIHSKVFDNVRPDHLVNIFDKILPIGSCPPPEMAKRLMSILQFVAPKPAYVALARIVLGQLSRLNSSNIRQATWWRPCLQAVLGTVMRLVDSSGGVQIDANSKALFEAILNTPIIFLRSVLFIWARVGKRASLHIIMGIDHFKLSRTYLNLLEVLPHKDRMRWLLESGWDVNSLCSNGTNIKRFIGTIVGHWDERDGFDGQSKMLSFHDGFGCGVYNHGDGVGQRCESSDDAFEAWTESVRPQKPKRSKEEFEDLWRLLVEKGLKIDGEFVVEVKQIQNETIREMFFDALEGTWRAHLVGETTVDRSAVYSQVSLGSLLSLCGRDGGANGFARPSQYLLDLISPPVRSANVRYRPGADRSSVFD